MRRTTHVVGIDPGKDGGIVLLRVDDEVKSVGGPCSRTISSSLAWRIKAEAPREPGRWGSMAWFSRILGMIFAIRAGNGSDLVFVIEEAELRSRQGGQLVVGQNWGLIMGTIYATARRRNGYVPQQVVVRANVWTKVARHEYGETSKERVLSMVEARLPDLDLAPGRCQKPQDGLSDAAGIALWYIDTHLRMP